MSYSGSLLSQPYLRASLFGAKTNGSDATTAIRNMFAEKDSLGGAVMEFDVGEYIITDYIDIGSKPFILKGQGWSSGLVDTFGSVAWNDPTYFDGTVIRQTTSGKDIFKQTSATANGQEFRDMLLIGPGAGTCFGIRATNRVGWLRARWQNLLICNCSTGFHPGPSQNCTSFHLETIGCTNGIVLDDTVDPTVGGPIDNRFFDTHVQGCTTGIYIANSYANWFIGGLVQSNGKGIHIKGIANTGGEGGGPRAPWEWHLQDLYFENNPTAGLHLDASVYQLGRGTLRDLRSGDVGASAIKIETDYPTWGISNVTLDGVIAKGADVTIPNGCYNWTIRRNCEFLSFANNSVFNNIIEYPHAASVPVAGTYAIGDFIPNSAPVEGDPIGWQNTVAGSPGTMVQTGILGAGGGAAVQIVKASVSVANYGTSGMAYYGLRHSHDDSIEMQFVSTSNISRLIVPYAMASAEANSVRLRLDYRAVGTGENPDNALTSGTAFTVVPGNNALTHELTSSDSADFILTTLVGRTILCTLTRIGTDGVNDTHTGDMNVSLPYVK